MDLSYNAIGNIMVGGTKYGIFTDSFIYFSWDHILFILSNRKRNKIIVVKLVAHPIYTPTLIWSSLCLQMV